MCGIFGFASGGTELDLADDAFFAGVRELCALDPGAWLDRLAGLSDAERDSVDGTMANVRERSYAWVQRSGFLRVLRDGDLAARLECAARDLGEWAESLDAALASAELSRQRDWEFARRLIVAARDVVWQIEQDCLAELDAVRELAGPALDAELATRTTDRAMERAWQLHLFLSSLNRLEVRGRDSAGIAVYVRFPGAGELESFLDGPDESSGWRHEVALRSAGAFTGGAVVQPASRRDTLLFAFKTASEIGKMGDNVAALRRAILDDQLFAAAATEDVELQILAHTRWASNGVISEENCHPVDSALLDADGQRIHGGEFVAALNGDIDNYQDLRARYIDGRDRRLDEQLTTDAKIIPVVVQHHFEGCGDVVEAFRRAFAEFEGSMAIGLIAADLPGVTLFGQKGSGQGLYFGLAPDGVAAASEMYGLVETTGRYVKAEGEHSPEGELFVLDSRGAGVEMQVVGASGPEPMTEERVRIAEITTRDINRGEHAHFLAKEISESVDTVRKTIRGKFAVGANGDVQSLLGEDVLPRELLDALRAETVRRIYVIGQGTAAIAASGVAYLMRSALDGRERPFTIIDTKATELSAHHLSGDLSDTLVIAISQSGTTTDTNRTVDLARERGAWVLGIVNRRNSDLVYKSHGVLYTSDGRDIEMSVASTKAFYAQNVAGEVLAQALAIELGVTTLDEARSRLRALEELPEAMARTLERRGEVEAIATRCALGRMYWAIVGSGATKISADEIRIKLSELCYKSIATDFIEDKKHIDLSSEPLVLVCASGASEATVSDMAKEVAIFKAHDSLPIVICDEGEERFAPYAAAEVRVPRYTGQLSYLLPTVVGHLFGYYAARAFDARADTLRRVRAELTRAATDRSEDASPLSVLRVGTESARQLLEFHAELESGQLDSGLGSGTTVCLARAIDVLLGRQSPDELGGSAVDRILAALTDAIQELARPIDAIKHQAKTVTVGISRSEATRGAIGDELRAAGIAVEQLAESTRAFVAAFDSLVLKVDGATVYSVGGLDALGRPTDATTIEVVEKRGCARGILSRSEDRGELSGTKWGVVRRRALHLGYGQTDGRRILILPTLGEGQTLLILLHLSLVEDAPAPVLLRALEAHGTRLEELRIAVTERCGPWRPDLLATQDIEALFFGDASAVAEALATAAAAAD